VLKAFFEGTEGDLAYPIRRESDEFDYGYALIVHKAQGSQWDDVLPFDESFAFREHRARWLYTGLTRAARRYCGPDRLASAFGSAECGRSAPGKCTT
jgi:exodeoxyribonuclease V